MKKKVIISIFILLIIVIVILLIVNYNKNKWKKLFNIHEFIYSDISDARYYNQYDVNITNTTNESYSNVIVYVEYYPSFKLKSGYKGVIDKIYLGNLSYNQTKTFKTSISKEDIDKIISYKYKIKKITYTKK